MKDISDKKSYHTGAVKIHVDTHPNPQIKGKIGLKTERYYVRIKLHRNNTSEKSGIHELKMALFDNGDPEELLWFIQNYEMMLEASGTLT